jgi:hypothetical protein
MTNTSAPITDCAGPAFTPDRPGHPVRVFLHQPGIPLHSGHRVTSVVHAAAPAALPDVTDGDPIRVDDLDAHLWTGNGSTHLTARRGGTGIWIRNADSPDRAIQLLRSMHPVDTTQPRS